MEPNYNLTGISVHIEASKKINRNECSLGTSTTKNNHNFPSLFFTFLSFHTLFHCTLFHPLCETLQSDDVIRPSEQADQWTHGCCISRCCSLTSSTDT